MISGSEFASPASSSLERSSSTDANPPTGDDGMETDIIGDALVHNSLNNESDTDSGDVNTHLDEIDGIPGNRLTRIGDIVINPSIQLGLLDVLKDGSTNEQEELLVEEDDPITAIHSSEQSKSSTQRVSHGIAPPLSKTTKFADTKVLPRLPRPHNHHLVLLVLLVLLVY